VTRGVQRAGRGLGVHVRRWRPPEVTPPRRELAVAAVGAACEAVAGMMTRVIWIVAIAACGGKPAPAGPAPAPIADAAVSDAAALEQDLAALVSRSLQMLQEVAAVLKASDGDCATATARLGPLAAAYRDVVSTNAKVVGDGRLDELRAAMTPHQEAFDSAAQGIMLSPTMARCAQDPAFKKALADLFEPPQ
jgi:hypothetical protein